MAHAEALLRAIERGSAALDGRSTRSCSGSRPSTPYLPRERPNPLLAAYLGLGLGLRLWRDASRSSTAAPPSSSAASRATSRIPRSSRTAPSSMRRARRARSAGARRRRARGRGGRACDRGIPGGRTVHPLLPFRDWNGCRPRSAGSGTCWSRVPAMRRRSGSSASCRCTASARRSRWRAGRATSASVSCFAAVLPAARRGGLDRASDARRRARDRRGARRPPRRSHFPGGRTHRCAAIEPSGTVNAIFRLGNDLAVRLPRRDGPTTPGSTELEWLPRLAPLLPLEAPVPVAQGTPTDEYPWFWEIHSWVDGETAPVEELDAVAGRAGTRRAHRARCTESTRAGAPRGRGIPLAERDREFRHWLARFEGDPAPSCASGNERSPHLRGTARRSGITAISMRGTGSPATGASPP